MSDVPEIFRLRTVRASSAPESVDEAAGIIRGASVIQAVEALGHNVMIDDTTLQQVSALGNAAGGKGIKVRFGHPGMCDDALGKKIAHATDFRLSADKTKVLADIQLDESASFNPSGDLRKWLLHEAKNNPGDFGMSVVIEAQRAWKLENGQEWIGEDRPKGAVGSLPFARVKKFAAVDFTEDPAANRDGLFSNADFAAAFSGTSNHQAAEAFAAIDSIRSRLNLSVDAVLQFAQRYAATRKSGSTHLLSAVGDRVQVKKGMNHDAMTKDAVGTVQEISTPALGIKFDGMESLHKWYVAEELQPAPANSSMSKPLQTQPTGSTMKLTAIAALALASAFPDQVAEIDRLANADHDEASIRAQLGAAQSTSLKAKVSELEGKLATQDTAHKAALKSETDKLSALQVKYDALKKISGAPEDVGGTPADKNLDGLTGEELWKAEFASSKEIRDRFAGCDVNDYISYKRREKTDK